MSLSAIIKALADAGATPQMIVAAVEAHEAGAEKEAARKRAIDAARTARYRARGGGQISEELRAAVYERDNSRCVYCGSEEDLQCDHVVPLAKGGQTTFENLATACRPCNARKKDRDRKAFERMSKDVQGQTRTNDGHPRTERNSKEPAQQKECPHTPKEKLPSSSLRSEEAAAPEYPIDPVERLWAEGLDQLAAMGVPERQRRPMIGKWLRDVRNDAGRLLDAIRRAREFGTKDPISLISRLLNPVSRNDVRKNTNLVEAADALHQWTLGADAREASAGDGAGAPALRLLPSTGRG